MPFMVLVVIRREKCARQKQEKGGKKFCQMSKCFSVVLLSALLLLASNLCCGGASSAGSPTVPFPPIVPHPMSFSNGTKSLVVNGNHMLLSMVGLQLKEVQSAFARFCSRTFVHQATELNLTTILMITVTTDNMTLQLGVDES